MAPLGAGEVLFFRVSVLHEIRQGNLRGSGGLLFLTECATTPKLLGKPARIACAFTDAIGLLCAWLPRGPTVAFIRDCTLDATPGSRAMEQN